MERRRILILGSSTVYFPVDAPEISVPQLLAAELRSKSPEVEWDVQTALLYPMPGVGGRTAAILEKFRPDTAFYLCSAIYTDETIIFQIRQRWPRLYGPARRLAALLEGPEGRAPHEGSSIRARSARVLESIAKRAIGVAPLASLEDAIAATRESFEIMKAAPGLQVVCRLTCGGARNPSQLAEIERRIAIYNRAIIEECDRAGFLTFDLIAEMKAQGLDYTREPDRIHGDLTARAFTAPWAAKLILQQLGSPPPGNRSA